MARNNALQITQVTLNNTQMNHLKGVTFSAQQKEENKSTKATHSRLLTVHYRWDWCGTGLWDVATRVGINIHSLTFWYQSFISNSNKSPTWCNNLSVYYPDVCLQPNVFRAFPRPSSGAQWLQSLSGKTPGTCWAVNKRQDNKLKNCCIRLVIYLN